MPTLVAREYRWGTRHPSRGKQRHPAAPKRADCLGEPTHIERDTDYAIGEPIRLVTLHRRRMGWPVLLDGLADNGLSTRYKHAG